MSISTNAQQISFIPFDQNYDIFPKLDIVNHKTLLGFKAKYNGLCELICNRILMDNDLGCGNSENYLKNRVTVERLNEEKITKSHLLNVYSVFRRVIAYLFGIFPDNIFSFWDQWKLVDRTKSVNNEILEKGLNNIENGETLKLEVIERRCLKFAGHALLIKKMANNKYIFFNPSNGEERNLSLSQLGNKINEQIRAHRGTNVFITKGENYLKKLNYQHP
jgi:hypothetical protein